MFSSPIKAKRVASRAEACDTPPTPPPTSPLHIVDGADRFTTEKDSLQRSSSSFERRLLKASGVAKTPSDPSFSPRTTQDCDFRQGIWPSSAVQEDPKLKRAFIDCKSSQLGGGYVFEALRAQGKVVRSDGSAISQHQPVAALVKKTAIESTVSLSPKKARGAAKLLPTKDNASKSEARHLWIYTLKKGRKKDRHPV
tara:strand:+ start:2306 stop:2896 length:591 start_codon:yes stop_codon:yes gene_type:complete